MPIAAFTACLRRLAVYVFESSSDATAFSFEMPWVLEVIGRVARRLWAIIMRDFYGHISFAKSDKVEKDVCRQCLALNIYGF